MSTHTMKINQAAWLDAAGSPFQIREAPMPQASSNEVVIRVHAVAINPVDLRRQTNGMGIQTYPHIIGCDGAGVVESIGSDVQHVKPGDRVMALAKEYYTHQSSHSMFQQFMCTGSLPVCKIPSSLVFEDACVLPLGVCTASGALFEKASLDLDWPRLRGSDELIIQKQKHDGEVVIVWGGSSSVGACAIQLLKAAGYRVIATASPRNFGLVKDCGAEATFDHGEGSCVEEICKWTEERGLQSAGVFAVVIDPPSFHKCGDIARRLPGKKFVSTTLPRGVAPEPDLGEGVKTSNCLGTQEADVFEHVWKNWMPKALENGQLRCLPKADVVGQGLEKINYACQTMGKGVSGKKLVVKDI